MKEHQQETERTVDPLDITEHALLENQPRLPEDDPAFRALVEDIRARGVLQPLIVTSEMELLDGRHRLRAARACKLSRVPAVIRPAEEALEIILGTLLARRHYTKSALAWVALPLIERAAEGGNQERKRKLKERNSRESTQWTHGKDQSDRADQSDLSDLGERLGIGRQTLFCARRLKKLFLDNAAAREGWLSRHEECRALREEAVTPWNEWLETLAEEASGLSDRLSLEAVMALEDDPPPCDLRELWEPPLLSGEKGLQGILAGMAGAESTKGKERADKAESAPLMLAVFCVRRIERCREGFERWDEMDDLARHRVRDGVVKEVKTWPEAVREALRDLLSENDNQPTK